MSQVRRIWIGAAAASALGFTISCSDAPPGPASAESALNVSSEVTARRGASGLTIPFADLELFLEFNSTDNDLGVQLQLDATDWEAVEGRDPQGRKFVAIATSGRLKELGLTELFWESAEPSPQEVLNLIPAGTYSFSGKTVDKETLAGTATLSHSLPPAPQFTPTDGSEVDVNNFVVTWNAIAGLASFQLIVADESAGLSLVVDLRPSSTSFRVPTEFLRRDTEYKIELLAIGTNGNKTITEATVHTKP